MTTTGSGVELPGGAVLREARPGDDAAVAAMSAALYVEDPGARPMSADDVRYTLQHLRLHPARGRAMVVEDATGAVGYALLVAFWSNELGGLVCVIDELYVRPEARGRGLGGAVLSTLAAGGVDGFGEAVALDLEVTRGNARARKLYERLGFRPQKNDGMRRRLTRG